MNLGNSSNLIFFETVSIAVLDALNEQDPSWMIPRDAAFGQSKEFLEEAIQGALYTLDRDFFKDCDARSIRLFKTIEHAKPEFRELTVREAQIKLEGYQITLQMIQRGEKVNCKRKRELIDFYTAITQYLSNGSGKLPFS